MSFAEVLKLGRTIGLENFSQLKPLVRTVQSGKPFKYNLRLVFDEGASDRFIKVMDDVAKEKGYTEFMPVKIGDTVAQIKKLFPVASGKDNKNILNLGINKLGEKRGFVSCKSSTLTPAGDVVASADAKVFASPQRIKARAKASIPEQNYAYDIEYAMTKGAKPNGEELAKALKMDIKNGLFTAVIPKTKSGGTLISANIKANEGLIDEMAKSSGGGYITSAKDMISQHQKFISQM